MRAKCFPCLWAVLFLFGFGVVMPAGRHRRSRITNLSFQKALQLCHLYHPPWHLTAPVLLQSLQKTKMLELSPEGCLSNILIKMINAIGPCWAFLTRNTPTFLTYCVVFQHKINFFFVQICLIAREERNGRLFTHYEVNS